MPIPLRTFGNATARAIHHVGIGRWHCGYSLSRPNANGLILISLQSCRR